MLSDGIRTLLSLYFFHSSIASSMQGFREAHAILRNARVLPASPPTCSFSVRQRTGIDIYSPACSVVTDLRPPLRVVPLVCRLLIHTFIRLCLSVSVSIRVFCVRGLCPCVSSVARSRLSFSLSCSLVQDPRGPASFHHALT